MNNEELELAIEKSRKKFKIPNFNLADLLREKIRRLGYGIEDTKDGPRVFKLNDNN